MKQQDALSIGDFELMARRHLPRVLFEAIASGVEDEVGLATNRAAFERLHFLPRACVDVRQRKQAASLFGQNFTSPFGIAPTGVAGLFRRGAETMLARAAASAGVPIILSGASMCPLESVASVAPASTWFQLYPAKDPGISHDMLRRTEAAGITTLVLTVDNPVLPNRERDRRNGFGVPPHLGLRTMLEALRHPAWVARWLRQGGLPMMESWVDYAPRGSTPAQVAAFFRSQSPTVLTWADLEAMRHRWPHRLVLKGVMHPADAKRAVDMGVDGIIVSNHGGKAIDRVPAPIDLLPMIRHAVRPGVPVMLDSGIRRGSDILAALCRGASFVFIGRPTLYAVAAAGEEGVGRAIEILRGEIDTTLGLIGCPDIAQLGPSFLFGDADTGPVLPTLRRTNTPVGG